MLRAIGLLAAAAAVATAAPYNFVTWGDYGTGSSLQKECAEQINTHCSTAGNCNFALTLGDNFYDGPFTTSDKRWKTELFDMYTFDAPIYACLGNHDYQGAIPAYLQQRGDKRWNFPATNYSVTIKEADLTIVYVDSPRACPSYMSKPYGDCDIHCMENLATVGCTNSSALPCWLEHVAWLNETLAAADTTWKFVAGHHPIDQENMPHMAPALAAHGVQAYFAGHVHNLQHAVGADGVQYFVSGAGAFAAAAAAAELPNGLRVGPTHDGRPLACPAGSVCSPTASKFMADGPGFLAVSIDNDAAKPTTTASFIHWNGTVLYTTTFSAN